MCFKADYNDSSKMPNDKTPEMIEEEGKMMTAYYRRHKEIEIQYGCGGIFWSPCFRCGAGFFRRLSYHWES